MFDRKQYDRDYYRQNKERRLRQNKEWRRANAEFLRSQKEGLECEVCGEDHPSCLEFHHEDPNEKELNLVDAPSRWGREKILEEISKCKVLCANCHRKLHSSSG